MTSDQEPGHHLGSGCGVGWFSGHGLPRKVEIAGLTIEGQSDEQNDETCCNQRCSGCLPDGLTYTRGPAARVIPVVGVNQHDNHTQDDHGENDLMTSVGIRKVVK